MVAERAGFAMAEVLMAIAVFSIVVGVSVDVGSRQLRHVAAAREESAARWLAVGILEELRGHPERLAPGTREWPLGEAGLAEAHGESTTRRIEVGLYEVVARVRFVPRGGTRPRAVALTAWIDREEAR